MVAVVEVGPEQGARQGKVTDDDGQPPPQQQPVATARRHRQPTPDHPPYCWMIGEALYTMGEEGGLEEDSISAFIRARYPGVPVAHDRLLRHYLHKHVAEGFFVRTAAGRYEHASEEDADVEQVAAGSFETARVGSPVAVAKRCRGRPRKDGSSSTSPASKKDGGTGAQSTTPEGRAVARADDSVPTSPVAVDDKDGSPSTPKRRRLSRGSAALLAAAVDTVPMALVAVAGKEDGSQAASSTPMCCVKRRASPRLEAKGSVPTLLAAVADKKDGSQAASSTPKLALVTIDGSATTSPVMDKACAEVPPTTPVNGGQPLDLVLVSTTDAPLSATTPSMEKDGGDAPSFNLALVAKDDGICATPTALEPSRVCVQALVAPNRGSAPVLVADKRDGFEEAPSTTKKHVRQPGKAGSSPTADKNAGGKVLSASTKGRPRKRKSAVVANGDSSVPTPVAGSKKAGRKVSFASPKRDAPAPVADQEGIEASAMIKSHGRPHKLYPVTADELLRDPTCVLLALPCQKPAAVNNP